MEGNTKDEVFVVDASFMLAHLLPDESRKIVDHIFLKHKDNNITLISAPVFPFEVLNGIKMAYLRKRINSKIAIKLSEDFYNTSIPLENINLHAGFLMAIENNLTVYDASYVQLSLEKQIPLLSLDKKLAELASASFEN